MMDPRETQLLKNDPDRRVWGTGTQPEFRVSVTLTLTDATCLWNAARAFAGRAGRVRGNGRRDDRTDGSAATGRLRRAAVRAVAGAGLLGR